MASYYKTKSQKKRALEAIGQKAFKLLGSGVLTTASYSKIADICNRAENKL